MTKQIKQLIHVLWAIEKDLRVIAGNTETGSDKARKVYEQSGKKIPSPFSWDD